MMEKTKVVYLEVATGNFLGGIYPNLPIMTEQVLMPFFKMN